MFKVYWTIHTKALLGARFNSYVSLSVLDIQLFSGFLLSEWMGSWKSASSPKHLILNDLLSLFISSYPMTLMKPGKASYSSLYLWSRYQGLVSGRLQGHGGKVSECWTAVLLLQRSSEAPAPSLVLSLFILKIPFGVKCILVHFICMSCLFHKLWGPKGGVTSSYLGSFPDPWRHAFKLSRWSNWNGSDWLLGQWVL